MCILIYLFLMNLYNHAKDKGPNWIQTEAINISLLTTPKMHPPGPRDRRGPTMTRAPFGCSDVANHMAHRFPSRPETQRSLWGGSSSCATSHQPMMFLLGRPLELSTGYREASGVYLLLPCPLAPLSPLLGPKKVGVLGSLST